MSQQVLIQQQATRIIDSSHDLYETTLLQAEISLQEFATTKTSHSFHIFQNILVFKHTVFENLSQEFIVQKTIIPASAKEIDALLAKQKDIQGKLNQYLTDCESAASWILKDSLQPYQALQATEQRRSVHLAWQQLNHDVATFETKVQADALALYDADTNQNMWMQLGCIVLAMGLVFWFFYLFYQEEKARKQLLTTIKNNTYTHLFNPGTVEGTDILEESVQNLKKATDFIRKTTEGEENVVWEGLNTNNQALNEQTLVGELQRMHLHMKAVKLEDQKRHWTNEGLSHLGDILRKETDWQMLADRILTALIKYVHANQGVLFVVNDNNPDDVHMELQAAYAYNRKKHISHTIYPGEGLAGQAWQENTTVYLTEIPQNYVRITSGLGDSTPANLLIVPLNHDLQTQGVVELASFRTFEPHEIAFVEKIAESIAATLASARVTKRTSLLLEDSREMAEKLKSQDEEMRQSMEELSATQEELQRKDREMNNVMNGIHAVFAIVEFDMTGTIIGANAKFLDMMGYSLEEVKGRHHRMFVESDYAISDEYTRLWDQLRAGSVYSSTSRRIRKNQEILWLQTSYVPLKDDRGLPYRILKLAMDMTNEYKLKLENQERLELIEACEEEMKRTLTDLMKQQMGYMQRESESQQRIAELESTNAELVQKLTMF